MGNDGTDYAAFGGYWDSGFNSGDLYSGDPTYAAQVGLPAPAGGVLPGDIADQQQMAPFNAPAAQQQGAPWWAGGVMYGLTRAIDNAFPGSPTGIMGNTFPGSIAGANGRTYVLRPLAGGGNVQSAQATVNLGGNPLLLLGLVALAFVVLK